MMRKIFRLSLEKHFLVGNQIVSNGFDTSLVEFSTTNVNGTTTFSWTNDLTTIGLAASGAKSFLNHYLNKIENNAKLAYPWNTF